MVRPNPNDRFPPDHRSRVTRGFGRSTLRAWPDFGRSRSLHATANMRRLLVSHHTALQGRHLIPADCNNSHSLILYTDPEAITVCSDWRGLCCAVHLTFTCMCVVQRNRAWYRRKMYILMRTLREQGRARHVCEVPKQYDLALAIALSYQQAAASSAAATAAGGAGAGAGAGHAVNTGAGVGVDLAADGEPSQGNATME